MCRFDNWTTPEYYKQAEDAVKSQKLAKEKAEQLERRRELLRKQLEREQIDLKRELKGTGLNSFMVWCINYTILLCRPW